MSAGGETERVDPVATINITPPPPNASEAVLSMPDPKARPIVTLDDGRGNKAKVVVTRRSKKPKLTTKRKTRRHRRGSTS